MTFCLKYFADNFSGFNIQEFENVVFAIVEANLMEFSYDKEESEANIKQ